MATQSISGVAGEDSGSGAGSYVRGITYSNGWSNVPIGARLTNANYQISAGITGTPSSDPSNNVEAYTSYTDGNYDSASGASCDIVVGGIVSGSNDFYTGIPNGDGSVGYGGCYIVETFYTDQWEITASSSWTLTFDPPPAKNLFFGTVG